MKPTGTTIVYQSNVPIEVAYRFVVDIDTPVKMVKGWMFLPGFTKYELLDKDWQHEGARRHVTLSDGSHVIEQINTLGGPTYFDYQLTEFTSPLSKLLVTKGIGQWWFEPNERGTKMTWRYSFVPKRVWLAPVVYVFVKLLYRRFMKSAVRHMAKIEQETELALK